MSKKRWKKQKQKKNKNKTKKGSLRWFHCYYRSSDLRQYWQSSVSKLFWFKGCETLRYLLIDSNYIKEFDLNNNTCLYVFCIVIFSRAHFSRKSCLMKTFAVMLCLKCLVSSFIDIIGVCHEISTEMFEVDIVSNERVLLNSALKLFVNFQKRYPEEDSGTRYFGTSIKNTHSSSMAFYMLSHHGGTCKPWSNLESRDLESSNTRLASKPL